MTELAHVFSFDRQYAMSQGAIAEDVFGTLLEAIPNAVAVRRAGLDDDRHGTDYWVELTSGDELSIDLKWRGVDPVTEYRADDLALETWSVIGTKRGWTLDPDKRTDYILWWWQPTRRWCLLPFPMLRAVFIQHQAAWAATYKVAVQETWGDRGDWMSECVFVPRQMVWRAIYERFGGLPVAT